MLFHQRIEYRDDNECEDSGRNVNTPFLTQSSRRVFMPHFGTQMASCH